MIRVWHDYAYLCELYMCRYVNYICVRMWTIYAMLQHQIIIHTIFVINKYLLLKQVYVRIKCILSSYQIYIRNTSAHTRMKWSSRMFDIVLTTTVCNPIKVYNIIHVWHDYADVCELYMLRYKTKIRITYNIFY